VEKKRTLGERAGAAKHTCGEREQKNVEESSVEGEMELRAAQSGEDLSRKETTTARKDELTYRYRAWTNRNPLNLRETVETPDEGVTADKDYV